MRSLTYDWKAADAPLVDTNWDGQEITLAGTQDADGAQTFTWTSTLAVGKVVKSGRTITVCAGELFASRADGEEQIAIMQATIANIAPRAHR